MKVFNHNFILVKMVRCIHRRRICSLLQKTLQHFAELCCLLLPTIEQRDHRLATLKNSFFTLHNKQRHLAWLLPINPACHWSLKSCQTYWQFCRRTLAVRLYWVLFYARQLAACCILKLCNALTCLLHLPFEDISIITQSFCVNNEIAVSQLHLSCERCKVYFCYFHIYLL